MDGVEQPVGLSHLAPQSSLLLLLCRAEACWVVCLRRPHVSDTTAPAHLLAPPHAAPCRVPAYYALILRSLTVLEGLALTANPNYKLIAAAYPYMARRLLTDPAPELR
jgi:hypothetical protein